MRRRRILRVLGLVIVVLGILAAGDAVMNKWGSGEVVTGIVGDIRQQQQLDKFNEQEKHYTQQARAKGMLPVKAAHKVTFRHGWIYVDGKRVRKLADDLPNVYTEPPTPEIKPAPVAPVVFPWHFHEGQPVMKIEIPAIHLSQVVSEGTDTDTLTRGPGRIIGTGTFGQTKRMAISGHRTTWSHPFRHVDQLKAGDVIRLTAFGRTLTYSVVRQFRVRPNQIGVLKGTGLILTTCDPPGSAAYRRIVQAKLTTPLTA